VILYLVDTDRIIDFLKGTPGALHEVGELADQGAALSIITYAELYEGVLGARNRPEMEATLGALMQTMDVIGVDEETAHEIARIRSDLRRAGSPIPDFDVVIAATALRHDLTLVSGDRHFERIEGLKRS
jgi:tRNA(fMet)-specific endonuclease VapC